MSKIPDPPTPVNDPTPNRPTTSTTALAAEAELLRNRTLEAWALVEALVDTLESLGKDVVSERVLALGVACERSCNESFDAAEKFVALIP